MSVRTAYIRSVGRFLPERRLTNSDLEKMVDTSDEWIVTRTGIRERRILEPGRGNSHMAVRAAQECLERAGVEPEEVEVIIVGTVTPDMMFPATACLVQKELGAKNAWGFDLSAGCSGFIFSLSTGAQMIESGRYKNVLVIGSDVMSSIIDYEDRNTCVLFGDGAGAVLLQPCPEEGYGILDFMQRIDGVGGAFLHMKAGGSLRPPSHETVANKEHYVYQEGKQVYKYAVTEMANVSVKILENNGLSGKDLALFVPHQANLRIIDACAHRMGIDRSKIIINIDRYANTTAATIPLCLYDALLEDKRVRKGDYLVLSAFGAGFTWGSILVRWWEEE
ncbi:beta-ketoacyl-ACP synthase III [Desulforhabdus amnigena]|jgi:3-oxoacyl-[acyl-carrier-protein] synthase-3|uniref:Beta-ketoacyl-[acyl-carrier-protein] synthase III n=1 Tax=Desulforhabdus amnigena TaxID=40218 RepID=A0A9W6CZC9_9BACT|nr:beta-ketoacyl-ACP synthase III [Desulforhabdus amnigena]NLJ28384.1 ketoacyl-ACP synthase III [Deltaproteobacteria bacterium]GLI34576.1 3-oxoacyl-[acyl-carrier-protein] synthase 3 [Desulforhabdus amnigena]